VQFPEGEVLHEVPTVGRARGPFREQLPVAERVTGGEAVDLSTPVLLRGPLLQEARDRERIHPHLPRRPQERVALLDVGAVGGVVRDFDPSQLHGRGCFNEVEVRIPDPLEVGEGGRERDPVLARFQVNGLQED
jgi:hypothetical protein